MKSIEIKNINELGRAAEEFVEAIRDASCIAFYGGMGAGKTTFIKAVCEVLGVVDVVNSPTFTIINEYSTATHPIFHFDFYRIEKIQEVIDLGIEDYFYGDGICLMEWPERIEEILPEDVLRVEIIVNQDDTRHLQIRECK